MSRTYRRRDARYDYYWVLLSDDDPDEPFWHRTWLDPRSKKGRRALARFHSDKEVTMGPAPHWYRRLHTRRLRAFNRRILRNWTREPESEPVFINNHRHNANSEWWQIAIFGISRAHSASFRTYP
jgi:hypothetical protein